MNLDLPASSGEPLLKASLKRVPKDFIVREQLDFEFDGVGEHLYLHIRKCGLNTNDITQLLQHAFGCQSVDIGVSGLKDKNAITDQWFSVRTAKTVEDAGLADSDLAVLSTNNESLTVGEFAILEAHRHSRKLRRGAHQFNQFIITLHDVTPLVGVLEGLPDLLSARLQKLEEHGFANYFGPQRFGHNAQNLVKAERMFKSPKRKISRVQRSLLLSSARSQLFNTVCATRVRAGNWDKPIEGEPMLLSGTNSYFVDDKLDETLTTRCEAQDIHPTGPMWGRGAPLSQGACAQVEDVALEGYEHFKTGLEKAGLEQQRRALRAQVFTLSIEWKTPQSAKLNFKLLKGVYATSLLAEFMINLDH